MDAKLLRKYSRFLYRHIHRYNYGWDQGTGRIQVPKEKLKRARQAQSNQGLTKLTEKHLKKHLNRSCTYFYAGTHKCCELLLCVDIDAHEGQSDALDVAQYLNFWWLDGNGYFEPSTHGCGVHLYFRVSYPEFTSSQRLRELFHELRDMMRRQVAWEGWESEVCVLGGLPSDWANDTMAQLIKLPRPEDDQQLHALLNLPLMTLETLRGIIVRTTKEHPSFESAAASIPSPSSCIMIVTNQGTEPDIMTVKDCPNPLDRALWTVRTLSHVLGRMPSLLEALDLYERLQLGTGTITPARVKRFEQAIAFTAKTFDPSKRQSFQSVYPVLKMIVEKAMGQRPGVAPTFRPTKTKSCSVSVESLCVGYYFALWQLEKSADGTLPLEGIVALNQRLLADKVVNCKIANQKASAIRRILVELGILELVDAHYQFGGSGRAMKYRLRLAAKL